jgi:hypothetical protein
MKKSLLICSVFLASVFFGNAQTSKATEHINQVWLGYYNQTRISNKWGIWTDVNLRTKENFTDNFSVTIMRVGLIYYVKNLKLTAGYAWADYFPDNTHKNISQPEHRPWQQVQLNTNYGRKTMMQWIRLEERFRHKILNDDALAPGYTFNYRVRYNIRYEVPLGKKINLPGTISLLVSDEVHINFGKQIVYNYFDQNRFSVGFKIQTSTNSNLQLGYLNVFQQLAAGDRYKNTNAIRLFYYQNIDLRHRQ